MMSRSHLKIAIMFLIMLLINCQDMQSINYGQYPTNYGELKENHKKMRDVNPIIQQILEYIKKNKLDATIEYSGKGLNDIGQYDSCLNTGNKYFFLIYVTNPLAIGQGVGVCTNQNVTETSLKNTLDATIIQYNLSSYINPQLLFPVDSNAHHVATSSGYVFVVFMFSLLALFNLLGVVHHFQPIPAVGKVCAAFDPFTNFQQVLTLPKRLNDEYNLDFYEGIRVAATFMVIFGHEYLNRAFYAVNQKQVNDYFTTLGFTGLENLMFSVDIFFYLSGFFISFSLIPRSITKHIEYLVVILYRYLRLMPLYLFMMLFYWQLIYRTSSGPRWPFFLQTTTQACNSMWRNVLLIDNFFKQDENYCYGWGWYLSNDFQMFLVSLIPISIYKANYKRLGKLTIWFLILFNIAYSLGFNLYYDAGLYNLDISNNNKFSQFDDVYDKIWQRWAVYYQGLLMGLYFVEFKQYNRQNKIDYKTHTVLSEEQPFMLNMSVIFRQSLVSRVIFYVLGGSTMIFFFLFKYNYIRTLYYKPWSKTTQQFFNVVERPAFTLGLILFLMPPLLQTSHYMKQFLGCYIFKFLSKLSYPMYLIHFQIQLYGVYSERQNVYFNFRDMLFIFINDTVITIFYSILAQIFIEYPFANLQAQLIKRPAAKKIKTDNDDTPQIEKPLDEKLLQIKCDNIDKEEDK